VQAQDHQKVVINHVTPLSSNALTQKGVRLDITTLVIFSNRVIIEWNEISEEITDSSPLSVLT